MKRITGVFAVAALFLAVFLSGCGGTTVPDASRAGPGCFPEYDTVTERRQNSQVDFADYAGKVEDLIVSDWYTDVLVVEFLTPGQYEVLEFGEVLQDEWGNERDYRSYGAQAQAEVLAVLKGEPSLVGQTVTIGEELLYQTRGVVPDSRYLADESLQYAIVCTRHTDDYYAYVCNTPEWTMIRINDDDTLEIWPFLQNVEQYSTLAAFTAMAQTQLQAQAAASEINALADEPASAAFSQAQRTAFTALLNDPENNGLLRSEYSFLSEIDLDEALILTSLPSSDTTQAERDAFAQQTGQTPGTLLKIDGAALDGYLYEKFTAAADVFSNFTWVYLEQYEAWYHAAYSAEPLEVTVTGGTVENVTYTIHYRFPKDGAVCHGTVVYHDFGNLSYFESNIYSGSRNGSGARQQARPTLFCLHQNQVAFVRAAPETDRGVDV